MSHQAESSARMRLKIIWEKVKHSPIGALPRNEVYLKNLAKELKVKTGCGGTYYVAEDGGTIELQGDHKEIVKEFFRTVKLKERFYV